MSQKENVRHMAGRPRTRGGPGGNHCTIIITMRNLRAEAATLRDMEGILKIFPVPRPAAGGIVRRPNGPGKERKKEDEPDWRCFVFFWYWLVLVRGTYSVIF